MELQRVAEIADGIRKEVGKAIVGQDEVIELMLTGLLCGGHILLEGVPGTGKTLLAQAFASTLSLKFGRVQFTPDMMPGDVLGTNLFNFQTNTFILTQGPIFTDLLLADETNPRSLAYQLVALSESIGRLPRDPSLPGRSAEDRLVLANLTKVRLAELDALSRAEESGSRPRLTSLLAGLEADLPVLSDIIAANYFSHLQTSRHLGSPGPT